MPAVKPSADPPVAFNIRPPSTSSTTPPRPQAHITHTLDMGQLRWLLTGGISSGGDAPKNPASSWLSEKSWGEALRLEEGFPNVFGGLAAGLRDQQEKYKVSGLMEGESTRDRPTPSPSTWQQWTQLCNTFNSSVVISILSIAGAET